VHFDLHINLERHRLLPCEHHEVSQLWPWQPQDRRGLPVWKSLLVDSEPPLSGDIDAKGSTVCFGYGLPNGTQGGCYDSMRDIWSFLDADFLAIPAILVKVALNDEGTHACFLLLNSQTLLTYLVCADARSIPISLKSGIPYLISLSL